ncbi:MAG: DUF222 domain-containing protein [Pseudonocardiaceae bacterium]
MTVAASSTISDEEIVGELRAAWAEVSRGYARCWAAMAEVAQRTTGGWESAEIAAALTFTARRADYELGCAQLLVDRLPRVHAALAIGELDHHKARVFTDYLAGVTPTQADRICERLVGVAAGWTTGQLAARLLREVQAIDPDYTRRAYQQAVRERAVHGYLDHTGTAVLSGSGLPAPEAAAAAARLEALADDLRAAGYPATVGQARADLFLRLLDGTLDGLTREQILATMLRRGPLTLADTDTDTDTEPSPQRHRAERDHPPPQRAASEQPMPAKQPVPAEPPDQPEPAEPAQQPQTGASDCPGATGTSRPARYGIEVRVRLSTLLGLDEHPAELPGWGPIPAAAARDLVAAQHHAEWRIAIVDTQGYLLHGDLTRRRPTRSGAGDDRVGGIVEIALPVSMLDQLPQLAAEHPQWARVLHGISGSWQHREQARAALDQHPHRRFAHAALRRHVQMRDRHCVGIGCRRRATTAELDHTRDHAHGGPTVTTNSGPNCGRHHTMKHQGGWNLHQPQAGTLPGLAPSGRPTALAANRSLPTCPSRYPAMSTPTSQVFR